MGKSGKSLAMDLVCWIWRFMNTGEARVIRPKNPNIFMAIPLTTFSLVPVRVSLGRRLSRGPNAPNRQSIYKLGYSRQ